ncbi:hypothetical protein ACFPFV_11560 [Salinicoccus siamensis]|uniref:hypothetical protein n=1 Tax=Salinicoccus siamensis TaxID=381830 RepID=UPI003608BD24
MEHAIFIIALSSLSLAVLLMGVNITRVGLMPAFSIKTRLAQVSLGLMGVYAIFFIIFLVMVN